MTDRTNADLAQLVEHWRARAHIAEQRWDNSTDPRDDERADTYMRCADELEAALSAPQAAQAVPQGWRLVPDAPTPEWIEAAGRGVRIGSIESVIADVLAAAPQQPVDERIAVLSAPSRQQIEASDLRPVIQWLENGCDPMEAAKELRLISERAALSAPAQEQSND